MNSLLKRGKEALNRYRGYSWEAKLFIWAAPTFRWPDRIMAILYLDRLTISQYIADALLCWVIIEVIPQLKSNK